jgi:hypothetical protein
LRGLNRIFQFFNYLIKFQLKPFPKFSTSQVSLASQTELKVFKIYKTFKLFLVSDLHLKAFFLTRIVALQQLLELTSNAANNEENAQGATIEEIEPETTSSEYFSSPENLTEQEKPLDLSKPKKLKLES